MKKLLPIFFWSIANAQQEQQAQNNNNILFIVSDDLAQHSMDRVSHLNPDWTAFTAQSTIFNQAIVPYPVCGPSRASFLTGLYPDRTKIFNFERLFPQAEQITNIPDYFKNKLGYNTHVVGKIFHNSDADSPQQIEYYMGYLNQTRESTQLGNNECASHLYCIKNSAKLADTDVYNKAANFIMQQQKTPNKPWALFVGFHRPHDQNSNQKKYLNLASGYQPDFSTPQIPGTSDFRHSLAHRENNELAKWVKVQITTQSWQKIISGPRKNMHDFCNSKYNFAIKTITKQYDAAVLATLDNAIKLIKQVDLKTTHIIFLGDNGFKLCDFGMYGKNDLSPQSTNVPLIFHFAGQTKGYVNKHPVSLRDIFPTLIDLEQGPNIPLDGKSLTLALSNENYQTNDFVFSQYQRCQPAGSIQTLDCMMQDKNKSCSRPKIIFMGYTMITGTYRYTEWREFEEVRTVCAKPSWSNMPETLQGKVGSMVWQLDIHKTKTNWNKPPIEQELYTTDENGKPYGNNLALDAKYAAMMSKYSSSLRQKLVNF